MCFFIALPVRSFVYIMEYFYRAVARASVVCEKIRNHVGFERKVNVERDYEFSSSELFGEPAIGCLPLIFVDTSDGFIYLHIAARTLNVTLK